EAAVELRGRLADLASNRLDGWCLDVRKTSFGAQRFKRLQDCRYAEVAAVEQRAVHVEDDDFWCLLGPWVGHADAASFWQGARLRFAFRLRALAYASRSDLGRLLRVRARTFWRAVLRRSCLLRSRLCAPTRPRPRFLRRSG